MGYALSTSPNAQLAKEALDLAIKRQQPNTNKLMFHSDQSVKYAASDFRRRLRELRKKKQPNLGLQKPLDL